MKRLMTMFLSAALLAGLCLPAMAADKDAAPSSWAADEVSRALELGFVPEDLQGNYQSQITRAEFAEISIYFLAAQYGYPASTRAGYGTGMNDQVEDFLTDYCDRKNDRTGKPFDLKTYDPATLYTTFRWWTAFTKQERFADIGRGEENARMRGFVNAAYALGIVNGTNDSETLFNPSGAITRQEAAAMLQRTYACYASVPAAEDLSYADSAAVADWAAPSVALMSGWGVMTGTGGNTFTPLGTYTREQCIVTFMRLYDNAPEGRAKGTLAPLYTYEENIQRLMSLGAYGSSRLYRVDTDACTVLYVGYLGGVQTYTAFRILYTDGTYRTVDLDMGYADGFRLSSDGSAVNFINVNKKNMSLDLATGTLSMGFRE